MSEKAKYKIGDKFGKRTIIDHVDSDIKDGRTYVKVRCECGNEDVVYLQNLLSGKANTCRQCNVRLMHEAQGFKGISKEPWYTIWKGMKARCYNVNNISYKNYGGRGIRVCEEWHDSAVFGEWAMSHGYEKGLQLDRIDNDGDYCPENCRWVTSQVNNNNRRNNVFVTVDDITDTLANTCRRYGLNSSYIERYKRIHAISYEDAIQHYRDVEGV